MRIDTSRFVYSIATAFAVAWLVCSAMVALMPGPMATLTGYMIHADLSGFAWDMGIAQVIAGLFTWSGLAAVLGYMTVALYNRGAGPVPQHED